MVLILGIETATQSCSVSLGGSDSIIASRTSNEKNAHATNISIFIDQVVNESGISFSQLDTIAVSKGPGSYTGLRIGVSTAKGLCYSIDKPLIGINTLQAMAYGMAKSHSPEKAVLLCPMIDARRMEVYSALFDLHSNELRETRAEIIDKDSFSDFIDKYKLVFFGDGAGKCREVLGHHPNSIFIDGFNPSADHIIELADKKFRKGEFENVAYFEPFYLKDFIAGKPRVKGLQ